MKKNICLFVLFFLPLFLFAEIGNYSYGEIPFGSAYDDIKEIFVKESISVEEYDRIEFQFNKEFNMGIVPELCEPYEQWGKDYKYESSQIGNFHNEYIKILRVRNEHLWNNISEVTFYFLDAENHEYKLFLYEKKLKYNDKYTNEEFIKVIENQAQKISSALNAKPVNKQNKLFRIMALGNEIGVCYTWIDGKNKIFFASHTTKNVYPASWVDSHLYYYDTSYELVAKRTKQKYIQDKEDEERRKSQEKMKKLDIDF